MKTGISLKYFVTDCGLYLQQAENILALTTKYFCEQGDKKILFG